MVARFEMNVILTIITINKDDVNGLRKTFNSALPECKTSELEYIVIDGNSRDGSKELILENQNNINKYIIEDDLGIFYAMNKGLKIATGEYVLFLNSGDTLFSSTDLLLDILKNDTNTDVFYSDVAIDGKNKIKITYHPLLLLHHCLNHQNMIVRRRFLKSGYNVDYKYSADVKWQIDFLPCLKVTKIGEPIAYFDLEGLSSKKDRRVVEKIWRERWMAHYTANRNPITFKLLALMVTSLIYLIKVLMPKFLSRTI